MTEISIFARPTLLLRLYWSGHITEIRLFLLIYSSLCNSEIISFWQKTWIHIWQPRKYIHAKSLEFQDPLKQINSKINLLEVTAIELVIMAIISIIIRMIIKQHHVYIGNVIEYLRNWTEFEISEIVLSSRIESQSDPFCGWNHHWIQKNKVFCYNLLICSTTSVAWGICCLLHNLTKMKCR